MFDGDGTGVGDDASDSVPADTDGHASLDDRQGATNANPLCQKTGIAHAAGTPCTRTLIRARYTAGCEAIVPDRFPGRAPAIRRYRPARWLYLAPAAAEPPCPTMIASKHSK